MKNKTWSLIGLVLLGTGLLTFQSCDKTQEEIIEDITPEMTATVSGANWTTQIAAGVSSTIFVVTGSKNTEAIVLTLPTKDVGVYPIDVISSNATYTPVIDSLAAAYVAFEGTIEVTSINTLRTQIQGTFNFKAANPGSLDTIHVTNGILKNIPVK